MSQNREEPRTLGRALSRLFMGRTVAQHEERIAWLFTLPTFLYVLIIFFIPAGYTIVLSLFSWNVSGIGDLCLHHTGRGSNGSSFANTFNTQRIKW